MMSPFALAIALVVLTPNEAADVPSSVVDRVTLSDGSVVLGEILEPPPARGMTAMIVRRAWVREHVPAQAARWEAAERGAVKRAIQQRRTRLKAWRTLRGDAPAGKPDAITPWLDKEIARLGHVGEKADEPLMMVKLRFGEIKNIQRSPKLGKSWLRMAWTSGFRNPESMAAADLKLALEGRGYDVSSTAPVSVDSLLPIREESDETWLSRRGATEVLNDSGLRFVSHQGMVFPEPAIGEPLTKLGPGVALSALKNLLDDKADDPLQTQLRELAAQGKASALVSRLDISPDFATVRVEPTG
jgi:hypothetical protein